MKARDLELIQQARPLVTNLTLGANNRSAATVAAAIRSKSGTIYTGVCLDLTCGIGFCAEHAAVAEMIKHGETTIETVVAVSDQGIYQPCGRCRELMAQINPANADTRVIVSESSTISLRDLLPHHYLF